MRVWLPVLLGLVIVLPASAAAQARVEAIVPATAVIEVQKLGSDRAIPADSGMELLPGDLLSAMIAGVHIELRCGSEAKRVSYRVSSPFRVLIDVPTEAACHVNMLAGLTEVIADTATQTSAGNVTLGSKGTQYSVEVRRIGDTRLLNCMVYDGIIETGNGTRAESGSKLVWEASSVLRQRNTLEDEKRSAAVYARFDLAAAVRNGVRVENPATALVELTELHAQVLANPADTARRVALSRALINYRLPDEAAYNLKRVDVTSEAKLRRYDIDPAVIRTDARSLRAGRLEARAAPAISRAVAEARPGTVPTTESDLALIAAGRVAEAMTNLDARVRAGSATSRDYFALAKAHASQGDAALVRANAGRALVLHARDSLLSAAELRELGELVARQN